MGHLTLVTGAAGFAGSHLLDHLAADRADTVGWHRPGGRPPHEVGGVRWQGVDLLDREAVRAAIRSIRPDVVYHCAGAAHVGHSWDTTAQTLRANVLGTHHLVESLRDEAPQARVLVTSSALVYGPSLTAIDEQHPLVPGSPYGLSKLAQELVALGNTTGPLVYIARPFNHFGPRQDPSFVSAAFARQIAEIEAGLRPPEIAVGNLEAQRDLTDVRDTVRAYRTIVERGVPGRPYNVCSGTAVAVSTVLEKLVSRARIPVSVVRDPARYRPNDTPIVLGDAGRISRELGWAPQIPLDRTLEDLLDYWRVRVRST
jgi:GDP-4-dehydro-6-deoxy-D-mannose reductase